MARATHAVGRNVLRKEGAGRSPARRATSTTSPFPACSTGAPSARRSRPARSPAIRFDFDTAGFTIVDHRDIPGRNVVALIDDDQPCLAERDDPPCRRADPAAGARGSRDACWRPTCRSTTARPRPIYDPERRRRSFKTIAIDKGDLDAGSRRPTSSSRASIAPATRSSSTSRPTASSPCRTAIGGITVYGSMQCPYYVHRALTVLLGSARRARCASSRPRPAAGSAARKSTRR